MAAVLRAVELADVAATRWVKRVVAMLGVVRDTPSPQPTAP